MKNRKPIFFTSDWHIGHENILKYDERPYKDLTEMYVSLIKNYNATVPKDGICYFLGDWGTWDKEASQIILSQLNGTKVLILGNHDGSLGMMYNLGFNLVLNSATIIIANQRITMSHMPLVDLEKRVKDPWKYSVTNENQFHLHGHCHSSPKEKFRDKQFDVGLKGNKYKPVSISEVESFIMKYKNKSKED